MSIEEVKKGINNSQDVDIPLPDLSILRGGRRKPPQFPLEMFGSTCAEWLITAAEGAGAPVDYAAMALLTTVAAAIGNARSISPWEGWVEPPALWGMNVGNPSSGKSPGCDPVLNLLRTIEEDMARGFEQALRDWKTKKEAAKCAQARWEACVEKAVKDGKIPPEMPPEAEEPREVIRARIIANDTSTEKLGLLLSAHKKGLLLFRDELSGWLGSFDRYSGAGVDRAFWMEAYGGRQYSIDRIRHPLPIRIPHLLVGVLGGIQPDKLAGVIHGKDDGLTARFLWAWPDPIPPSRPRRQADATLILAALHRLTDLKVEEGASEDIFHPRIIMLTEDAIDLFQEWRTDHIQSTKHTIGLLASSYGKAPGHVLRLALSLEYLWWAITPGTSEPSAISKKAIAAAAHLMDNYFKLMAERVFGDVSIPEEERLAAILANHIVRKRPKVINLRDIRREAGLSGLRHIDKVKMAVDVLIEAAWIFPPSSPVSAGRPRHDYTVNPKLWEMLP